MTVYIHSHNPFTFLNLYFALVVSLIVFSYSGDEFKNLNNRFREFS